MSPCLHAVKQRAGLSNDQFTCSGDFLLCPSWSKTIVSRNFFTCPVSELGDCFTHELLRFSPTPLRQFLLVGTFLHFFPTSARSWFNTLWLPIVTQAKPHIPVDCVLNLHNGRDVAAGPRRSATLLPFILVAKKCRQESYRFYVSLPAS